MFRAPVPRAPRRRAAGCCATVLAAVAATALSWSGLAGEGATSVAAASSPAERGLAAQQRISEQPPIGTVSAPRAGRAPATGAWAVAAAATSDGKGFWVAWSDGQVTTAGDAHWHGDASRMRLNGPIVGIAATRDGGGYWLLGRDGGVFSFGDAGFHGSTGGMRLNAPALQMSSTRDSQGYDFVAADGGIFSFGDAAFHGSTGDLHLAAPVVGMASTPNGGGYWLLGRDGGVFSFGNAGFHGSTGATPLAAPMVAVASTSDGGGYWLLGRDGGVFAFGDAAFHGSAAGHTGGSPAVGLVATSDGGGYWIVLHNGRVLSDGDAGPIGATGLPSGAAASTVSDDHYTFEVTNAAGQPARWNPCEPVRYAVVDAGAPTGWQTDVGDAISRVAAATDLPLVDDGTYASTSEVPSSATLTIRWVSTLTSGDMVGLTTYWYYDLSGYTPQLVSARIELLSSLHGGAAQGGELPVLLHELGHAFGLGHTPGAPEVMNPVDQGYSAYQPGDLAGLARVGETQGCAGFYR